MEEANGREDSNAVEVDNGKRQWVVPSVGGEGGQYWIASVDMSVSLAVVVLCTLHFALCSAGS